MATGFVNGCNPIKKVKHGNTTITDIPCPSSYAWKKEDVSKATAGRTESGVMKKEKLIEIVALELSWSHLTTAQAQKVLKAFSTTETFQVQYLDPKNGSSAEPSTAGADGNYFVTKTFYVGDMSAPLYSTSNNRWENISFNIIATGG